MAPKKKTARRSSGEDRSFEGQKKEIEVLKNQLVRALADYDNLAKRVEREREDYAKLANARLVIRLLPIYDMLEGAQAHLKDSGLEITINEFTTVLKDEGFEKIDAKPGDEFDEEIHEAVELDEGENEEKGEATGPEGKITKVILTGWKFSDGSIVRPAKVKVAK